MHDMPADMIKALFSSKAVLSFSNYQTPANKRQREPTPNLVIVSIWAAPALIDKNFGSDDWDSSLPFSSYISIYLFLKNSIYISSFLLVFRYEIKGIGCLFSTGTTEHIDR